MAWCHSWSRRTRTLRHCVLVADECLRVEFECFAHEFGDAVTTVSFAMRCSKETYPQTTTSSIMLPHKRATVDDSFAP